MIPGHWACPKKVLGQLVRSLLSSHPQGREEVEEGRPCLHLTPVLTEEQRWSETGMFGLPRIPASLIQPQQPEKRKQARK